MKRVQYDLDFKMEIVRKGNEMGNFTAVARQHELDPKMVLRWARDLKRKDVDQLDKASKRQVAFIPTAEDFKQLEHENEKLKKLLAEQALEREILKDLLKNKPKLTDKIEIARKYIGGGHCITFVLRVLEVERSTYYAHVNKTARNSIQRRGRPAPGYSFTSTGTPVSDEEICEWLMEYLAGEGVSYGYRKLTVLLKRRHQLVMNKKKV